MKPKLVGILVVMLLIITIFPINGMCEYNEYKVDIQNNSDFGIFFVKGGISESRRFCRVYDLFSFRFYHDLSSGSNHFYFVANDLDLTGWSKNDGLINTHFNDDTVRCKKPFFGLLTQTKILGFSFYPIESVYFIKNMNPPDYILKVPEGDCGESCIWSILHYYGINATKKEINEAGGDPGRGLHGDEILIALDYYNITYNDLSSYGLNSPEDYEQYLQTNIVDNIKNGHPLLIGVKIYPDKHPEWCADHFILIIGYTSDDELIYNSSIWRYSIEISKLINTEDGYSLINQYGCVYCIEFPLT